MDDRAEGFLRAFIETANKDMPHALDWQRFYDFIIAVHREGLQASEGEIGSLLWASGFSSEVAGRLQTVFTRGLDLPPQHRQGHRFPHRSVM